MKITNVDNFSSDEDINEIRFLSYLCHEYFFVIKDVDEQHMIPFSLYFLKLLEIIKLSKNLPISHIGHKKIQISSNVHSLIKVGYLKSA